MSQDLQLFASTPRNDGMKYIVKFYSKIGGDEHWFSIVMPVQTSDVALWDGAQLLLSWTFGGRDPIPWRLWSFPRCTSTLVRWMTWHPRTFWISLQNGHPADHVFDHGLALKFLQVSMGRITAEGRQLVKNVVLSVPRTYNVHDSNANRDYFRFSYELDNGPEVIDLTVDSASDDDA